MQIRIMANLTILIEKETGLNFFLLQSNGLSPGCNVSFVDNTTNCLFLNFILFSNKCFSTNGL